MKCKISFDRFARTVFEAVPGEYDGYPSYNPVSIDTSPIRINRFRFAVASVLPYLAKTNGALETETPLFPLSASTLREWAPFDIAPTNIEWAPSDIPSGSGVLFVSAGDSPDLQAERILSSRDDVAELRLVRSDQYHGSLATVTSCIAGSNAWLVRALGGDAAFLSSLVAIGLLFGEDFDARSLVIAVSHVPVGFNVQLLSRVTESVGMQLSVLEVDGHVI